MPAILVELSELDFLKLSRLKAQFNERQGEQHTWASYLLKVAELQARKVE
jgi:hypothetical protein